MTPEWSSPSADSDDNYLGDIGYDQYEELSEQFEGLEFGRGRCNRGHRNRGHRNRRRLVRDHSAHNSDRNIERNSDDNSEHNSSPR